MNKETFFFYDLETSGLSPRDDRIMQFAGIRTDLDLNPIGEPVNLLVQLPEDTLPSPDALMVTKITPQQTRLDGLSEPEFCKYVSEEIFTPGTIAVGYNSVRFDDEFMRFTFWRNFYDPYEWQWKDGRSRWDLLDVVRMTRALRPEGIKWPFQPLRRLNRETGVREEVLDDDGEPVMVATNRLELITELNDIKHEHAHDALSDVEALISVTRLIREKQPKLYEYLLAMRDKKRVASLVDLERPAPFVYSCGEYPSVYEKTSVAYPLCSGRTPNSILVYDLRYDPDEVVEREKIFPVVKELCLNKCPAVAPLGVLEADDGWSRIGLSREIVEENLAKLRAHPEFIKTITGAPEKEFDEPIDAEAALYDGFLSDSDRTRVEAVRNTEPSRLAGFSPDFSDKRLAELLVHYKGRNFPDSLSDAEAAEYAKYRIARLNRQAVGFMKAMERLQSSGDADEFILEELGLWWQGLQE
ncbi:exodeoxyribonuclease I [Candidatus Saccharibacteria bacterium]|nr:exodeoxyribonuclease I [Candidatus Saccharibacteria bacterium]